MTAKRSRQGGEGPFRLQSIRSRMLVAFILLVLLPTAAVSLTTAYMGYENGKGQVYNQLESVVALKEAEIRTWAEALHTELSLALGGAGGYQWVDTVIRGHLGRGGAEGDVFTPHQAYLLLRDSFLRVTESSRSSHLKELFLIARDGRVLLSTDIWNEGLDLSEQHFFHMGMENAGVHVERAPSAAAQEGAWSIFAVEPVFSTKGEVLGVLAGRADTDKLNQAMAERSGMGQTGETYLVGEGGMLLTDSRYQGYVRGESILPGYSGLFMAGGSGRGMYDDYRGIPVIGVYRSLGEFELVLVAEKDQAEAFKPIYATLQLNLMVAVLAVILAVMASAVYTRGLAGRLDRLARTARSIARGSLDVSAPVMGEREIRALAASFNAMTARLNRRIEMENLVGGISRELISIQPENADEIVQEALGKVGGYLDVERMGVFMLREGDVVDRLIEWKAEGVPEREQLIEELSLSDIPWFRKTIRAEGLVHVPRMGELPPEAGSESKLWTSLGIRSMVVAPINPGGVLRGFLSCETCWGERYWAEDELSLLEIVADSVGSAVEYVSTLKALRRSEERYALAQKAANIGSWDWDIEKGKVYCSDAFEPVMGLEPGTFDHTFRSFLKLGHPEDRPAIIEGVRNAFRHGTSFSIEHRLAKTVDGRMRWIYGAGALYRNQDGKPVRMLGIVRDITNRKRAEVELAAINRHLELLVEARTRDLELKAEELLQANERLRELDKLKSSFLASVSHELRTPLTSILGFAKLIRKDFNRHFSECCVGPRSAKGERIEANLGIILKEGGRLTRLINDVLDLTKIEAGKVEWRDREVIVAECVGNAAEATAMAFAQKPGVELALDVEPGLPTLFVDQDRLTQVFINLLDNAAKFTEQGAVILRAGLRGDSLVIRVEDSGSGIDEGELEKVFDTFHQASKYQSLENKPEGTGLGLAICRQIVEHYEGRIWVESKPGNGSCFVVELPLERAATASGADMESQPA